MAERAHPGGRAGAPPETGERAGRRSEQGDRSVRPLALAEALGLVLVVVAGAVSVALATVLVLDVTQGETALWVLGRASGVTSYVLLVALVSTGLVLAHPWSRRLRRPRPATVQAVHVSLATFTLTFTVLHVAVLATDPWAQVGWRGALLPMASQYRPVAVTLGVLALWSGLVTGLTARLAGHAAARVWWPVHKFAAGVLLLVWAHSVLAGTDAAALRGFYLATGALVTGLALTRYAARTPADRVRELGRPLPATRRTGARR